jgi:uncharacterized membrane protein YczE
VTLRRTVQLLLGCVVLGVGVALLLTPELGSDGFSSLVNGIRLATGIPFVLSNLLVSLGFVALAWVRGVRPGVGTLAQVAVVGTTVSLLLPVLEDPGGWWGRAAMLAVAVPVAAVGIALYLGSHLGAGPAEAAALAWDPPVPFSWSYGLVQGGGALVGWLLGAAIGPGTLVVILLLGPVVTVAGRLLRLDLHQDRSGGLPPGGPETPEARHP